MPTLTNQLRAQENAAKRAAEALASVDLGPRCAALGLPAPANGTLACRLFGRDALLTPPAFDLHHPDATPARSDDRLLALHYLLCATPITPTSTLISFRDLPGGQFYYGPFRARSAEPLAKRIGNNLDLLRAHLARFDHQLIALGDLAARIHVIGRIEVTLVYHLGDDAAPPTADILFDSCIRRVFATEDAAAIASRICLGLL